MAGTDEDSILSNEATRIRHTRSPRTAATLIQILFEANVNTGEVIWATIFDLSSGLFFGKAILAN